MVILDPPANEAEVRKSLDTYNILDTLPQQEYDSITRIASYITNTPISLITFFDGERQFFKSHHGTDVNEATRDHSFCSHAMAQPYTPLVIEDAKKDHRFHDNPLVTGPFKLEFYSGVTLVNEEGLALGTLCVFDHTPRKLSEEQITLLQGLGNQVIQLMESRRHNASLERSKSHLSNAFNNLNEFAHIVSHDLNTPLRQIASYAEIIEQAYVNNNEDDIAKYLPKIKKSVDSARGLVKGVLKYSRATHALLEDYEPISIDDLIHELIVNYEKENLKLTCCLGATHIVAPRIALYQILANLISNSVKYNDKDFTKVLINIMESNDDYNITLSDNSRGIPDHKINNIFSLFYQVDKADKVIPDSYGVGLSIVKKMVSLMEGHISVSSKIGTGSTFNIQIPKKIFAN